MYHVILYNASYFTHRNFDLLERAEAYLLHRNPNVAKLGIIETAQFIPHPGLTEEDRANLSQAAKFYWACVYPHTENPHRCERRPCLGRVAPPDPVLELTFPGL